jgi:SAM-dependent methyltransferase
MVGRMADDIFEHPRLVAIYDALDPDRSDLDVYAAIADELGAGRVLDVGCGTGTFALLLAHRGLEVTGVDPAGGSLGVARAKPGAERVHWIHGDATTLPPMQVDLATMTANVAQAIVDPSDWEGTLRGVYDALRPGGHLVFETRDPAYRAWQEWNRAASYTPRSVVRRHRDPGGRRGRELGRRDRRQRAVGELPRDVRVRFRRGGVDVGLDAALPRA